MRSMISKNPIFNFLFKLFAGTQVPYWMQTAWRKWMNSLSGCEISSLNRRIQPRSSKAWARTQAGCTRDSNDSAQPTKSGEQKHLPVRLQLMVHLCSAKFHTYAWALYSFEAQVTFSFHGWRSLVLEDLATTFHQMFVQAPLPGVVEKESERFKCAQVVNKQMLTMNYFCVKDDWFKTDKLMMDKRVCSNNWFSILKPIHSFSMHGDTKMCSSHAITVRRVVIMSSFRIFLMMWITPHQLTALKKKSWAFDSPWTTDSDKNTIDLWNEQT